MNMVYTHTVVFGLIFMCLFDEVYLLENGVARTPPMGWMSWGYFMCADKCKEKNTGKCLDEKLILSVADAFYEEGYQEAGFEYIIIDDCWSEHERDSRGHLVPDAERFPRGMKFLADYIHARGLKFGMYMNIAEVTCMNYPGSRGYFDVDAKTFADWGVDYIKVDGCFVEEWYLDEAYTKLGKHFNTTGRSMVYSCSWPFYKVFIHKHPADLSQIQPVCNLWRNFHDVVLKWEAVKIIINFYENEYNHMHKHHGPGHWNDPDMLLFGTDTLNEGQSRIQLAVYAMMSAPLLISCNMSKITAFEKSLLLNQELMAIDQDPLGIMAKPYKFSYLTMWVKPQLPMKGDMYHSYSFALVNFETEEQFVSFSPTKYGLNATEYTILDVFSKKFLRNITSEDSIEVVVPAQDVLLYTLFPL